MGDKSWLQYSHPQNKQLDNILFRQIHETREKLKHKQMTSFPVKIIEKSIWTNLPCFTVFDSFEMSYFLYQLQELMEAYTIAVTLWGNTGMRFI